MKFPVLPILFGALALTVVMPAADAATVKFVSRDNSVNSGSGAYGGAFLLKTSEHGTFESFCLEVNEYTTVGATYNYTVSTSAKSGGAGGAVNGADQISKGTAYLYSEFISGKLSTLLTGATAYGKLQEAFWFLEEEISGGQVAGGVTSNPFLSKLGNTAAAITGWRADAAPYEYGVGVMNITDSSGKGKQDQLVSVPDGGATVALLGLSLSGIALVQRRLSKAGR